MADTKWFQEARFGLFIHWGLYAVPARGEWYASIDKVPGAQYEKYFHAFDPIDYNPRLWARMAREAGMKYAVLTAKHHEGLTPHTPITKPPIRPRAGISSANMWRPSAPRDSV